MNKIVFFTVITLSSYISLGALKTSPARAFEIFTDRDEWLEALAGKTIVTETFDDFIPDADRITFNGGIISEGFNGGGTQEVRYNLDYSARVDTDEDELGGFFFNEITWTFPKPIFAFGGDFINAAQEEILQIFGNYDGNGETFVDLAEILGFDVNGFLGIIGEAKFNSITYRTRTDDSQTAKSEGFLVDNFSSAPIPEPLTVCGVGIAVGLGGFFKHQINKKTN